MGVKNQKFKKKAHSTKDEGKVDITCYNCKKSGLIKSNCPLLKKMQDKSRRKKKKVLIGNWSDIDDLAKKPLTKKLIFA